MKNFKKWTKIDDLFFTYKYKDSNFLIQTYPFKIYSLSKNTSDKAITNIIKENKKVKPPVFSLKSYYLPLLIATTACNFKCKYCYAHEGTYGEKAMMMNKDVISGVIGFLRRRTFELQNNISFSNKKEVELGVVYFGGESLLHLEGLKFLIKELRYLTDSINKEKKLKFKVRPLIILNTNGSLFSKENLKLIKENKDIFELIVSFDGIHHDKYRILKSNDEPTSELVIKGLKSVLKEKIKVTITCCVPPDEIEAVDENIKYITKLFSKDLNINFSFIRGSILPVKRKAVYPGILEKEYSIKSLEIFGEKTASLIKEGYNIYTSRFLNRIREGCFPWRCAASLFEMCIYPDGRVYSCHNFIDKDFELGNIMDPKFDPAQRKNIVEKFKSREVFKIGCSDCVFQTMCLPNFDCPSHSYYDLGDFNKVDERTCIAAKKIMEALLEKTLLEKYYEMEKDK